MKRFSYLVLVSLLPLFILSSCDDDESIDTLDNGLIEVASSTVSGLNLDVTIFSDTELQVGYNRLQIKLTDKNTQASVTDADVKLMPIMHMPNMMHTTPISIPDTDKLDGMYQKDVMFIMPSEMGRWELSVAIDIPSTGMKDTVSMDVTVSLPAEEKMKSFLSQVDSSSLFVSLVEPTQPIVGANDFTLMIHRRENMMSFPPLDDLQVEIEPEMPTMGHGSEGNIHPVSISKGMYEGTVSFNMPGFWRIHVVIKDKENREVGKTSFDMTF